MKQITAENQIIVINVIKSFWKCYSYYLVVRSLIFTQIKNNHSNQLIVRCLCEAERFILFSLARMLNGINSTLDKATIRQLIIRLIHKVTDCVFVSECVIMRWKCLMDKRQFQQLNENKRELHTCVYCIFCCNHNKLKKNHNE